MGNNKTLQPSKIKKKIRSIVFKVNVNTNILKDDFVKSKVNEALKKRREEKVLQQRVLKQGDISFISPNKITD